MLATALIGLATLLDGLLWLYMWVLIVRAVVSWVSADPRNPIVRFLHRATDPPVELIRRLLPTRLKHFPVDIAFLALFALVLFLRFGLVPSMFEWAQGLRSRSGGAQPRSEAHAAADALPSAPDLSGRSGRATLPAP